MKLLTEKRDKTRTSLFDHSRRGKSVQHNYDLQQQIAFASIDNSQRNMNQTHEVSTDDLNSDIYSIPERSFPRQKKEPRNKEKAWINPTEPYYKHASLKSKSPLPGHKETKYTQPSYRSLSKAHGVNYQRHP